jgi:chemotaxis protein methyltransferase CheR
MTDDCSEPVAAAEATDIRELLDVVYGRYGFDFRDYAFASIRRRVLSRLDDEGVGTVMELREKLLRDEACMERLLQACAIHVTAMFRDPDFYRVFRAEVVPVLRTYPFIRIWHAGCSSGEEVYSMAIVLEEEGIYDRCRLYATDMSESVLAVARAGIVPLGAMREYTANYMKAGGTRAFSDYYVAKYDGALLNAALRRNIIFAPHNLATDRSFNEFHCILCRNVIIYFNEALQNRVLALLNGSLVERGFLGLGAKETLRFTELEASFNRVGTAEHLYRKERE